jgi:type IX secretion system PorP/SprF family membrane protein
MNILKKTGLLLALVSVFATANADPNISHGLLTQTHYNPATTGSTWMGNITLLGRHQFMGFEGAPTTGLLNMDLLAPGINSGFGLSVSYDKYGPISTYNAIVNYAYHIGFGEHQTLSLGVGAGIQFCQYDGTGNIYESPDDPIAYYEQDTQLAPDVNIGVQYTLKNWVIGASITHLQRYFMPKDLRFEQVNYHLYTRYRFEVARYWNIVPSVAVHYDGVTVNEEVNLLFEYTKAVWFGASYRMSNELKPQSVVPMIGFNITEYVKLGYAYEHTLTDLQNYNSGTHELMLTVRFKTQSKTYKTPRFAEW